MSVGPCGCFAGDFAARPPADTRRLDGSDARDGRFADVTVETCRACGRRWLGYAWEVEGISRSGRWYRGLTRADVEITVENAAATLESLDWYWAGGSYFDGRVHRARGPL